MRTALVLLAAAALVRAEGLVPPLTPEQASQASRWIKAFRESPRGPFLRIRWFCNDGTVHPPQGVPCRERGGGRQHAERNEQALQLSKWGIDTGTILAALPFEEAFDAGRDHWRLKELILEKYLAEVQQGWIYGKAVSYRGARQIEDEEKAGRALLIRLLADREWTRRNFFLAQQLAACVPHGIPDSRVKRIRNLATAVAEADGRFQFLRAKIHSFPGPEDEAAVRAFLKEKLPGENVRPLLEELAAKIGEQYASRAAGAGAEWLSKTAAQAMELRRQIEGSANGAANLRAMDALSALLEAAFAARVPKAAARREALERQRDWFRLAAAAGLLSFRQLGALEEEIAGVTAAAELEPEGWRRSAQYLGRAAEWARAAVMQNFGPVSRHWAAAEPAAASLVDHLLRGSVALAMTASLDRLVHDANRAAGVVHSVFGENVAAGVSGLNPGVAVGKLYVIRRAGEAAGALDARGIYVLPETVSDLKPVAGILTLDSGNALSHAQILAANLGIPNSTVPSSLLGSLEKYVGKEVLYAVTPRHVVLLRAVDTLSAEERKLWLAQPAAAQRARIELDTSRLQLDNRRILKLTSLSTGDSGVVVGPKAANLGELASYFPKEVAPGLVLPFGIFYAHIDRVLDGSGETLRTQIARRFAEVERMRERGAEAGEINRFIHPHLAAWRKTIESMPLLPEFERELRAEMDRMFGRDGTYGVFVRSDTNAEDLPEFTGAGLNRTVPNVVGFENVLKAVREVWASPYSERAFEWRNRALKGSERVYPSVIVMRTVPSDVSGVIATVDLETGDRRAVTVNASEGVSAVVDGGVAESLLLLPDGKVRLLQQARAGYRRVARPEGGFANLPPLKNDELLSPANIAELRRMVAEVERKYPPAKAAAAGELPWDIEFGFEKSELRLFQIRPLVRFQEFAVLDQLSKLEGRPAGRVRLDGELNE
jgi:hypothetical protein